MATDPHYSNIPALTGSDEELREWLESMESLLQAEGPDRAKQIFRALRDYLTDVNVIVDDALGGDRVRAVLGGAGVLCGPSHPARHAQTRVGAAHAIQGSHHTLCAGTDGSDAVSL